MNETDERELIRRAQEGSARDFERLAVRYQDGLLRLLALRSGSRADAEDALQETMVAAWRYIDSYNPRWQFSTWLYRIGLRNLARVKPAATLTLDEAALTAEDHPERWCEQRQTEQNLWTLAARTLDRDVLVALWLRYAEDMAVNDIGKVLARSSAWVKVNLYRARKKLEQRVLVRELASDRPADWASAKEQCS